MLDAILSGETGISNSAMAKLAVHLASVDKTLSDGAGDYLQLMNTLATVTRCVKG